MAVEWWYECPSGQVWEDEPFCNFSGYVYGEAANDVLVVECPKCGYVRLIDYETED